LNPKFEKKISVKNHELENGGNSPKDGGNNVKIGEWLLAIGFKRLVVINQSHLRTNQRH
jgi:hypothetical protein